MTQYLRPMFIRPLARLLLLPFLVLPSRTMRADQDPVPMSEAEGTELVATLCSSCHAVGRVYDAYRTPQDWNHVLTWMLDEGAAISDEEFDDLFAFLSVYRGRVAVNAASIDDVRHVLELTAAQAGHVEAARAAHHHFSTLEDLADAAGVSLDFIKAREARIDFAEGP